MDLVFIKHQQWCEILMAQMKPGEDTAVSINHQM